jgi:hypothetical protein
LAWWPSFSQLFSNPPTLKPNAWSMLKVDGLPLSETVDRFVRERDPQTGKSRSALV